MALPPGGSAGDGPDHDRRVEHVVVEREIAAGDVLDARVALQLPMAPAERAAVAWNSSGCDLALPESLDRPFQFPANADPREAEIRMRWP